MVPFQKHHTVSQNKRTATTLFTVRMVSEAVDGTEPILYSVAGRNCVFFLKCSLAGEISGGGGEAE